MGAYKNRSIEGQEAGQQEGQENVQVANADGVMRVETTAPKIKDTQLPCAGKTIVYDLKIGSTIADMISIFGEKEIYKAASFKIKNDFQAALRNAMQAGRTEEEVLARAAEWKPGQVAQRTAKTDEAKVVDFAATLASMDPEKAKFYIEQMMAEMERRKMAEQN